MQPESRTAIYKAFLPTYKGDKAPKRIGAAKKYVACPVDAARSGRKKSRYLKNWIGIIRDQKDKARLACSNYWFEKKYAVLFFNMQFNHRQGYFVYDEPRIKE